jgi:hypothetical protein
MKKSFLPQMEIRCTQMKCEEDLTEFICVHLIFYLWLDF